MAEGSNVSEKGLIGYLLTRREADAQEIARHLDVPYSTAASILTRLVGRGVIRRGASAASGQRGRPSQRFGLRLPQPVAVLQLDGTQLIGSVVSRDGVVGEVEVFNLMHIRRREQAVSLVRDVIRRVLRRSSRTRRPIEIADAVAGVAMSINGARIGDRMFISSVLPWAVGSLEASFAKAIKLPVRMIPPVEALAEYQKLTAPLPRAMVRFRVADGVGAQAVVDGHVYRGGTSLAGEVGHIALPGRGPRCGCGRRGCLEARCSGPAIVRRLLAGMRKGIASTLDAKLLETSSPRVAIEHVWQQWRSGDSLAVAVMDEVLDELAWGLSLVINLFDPDRLVAGGYVLHDKSQWIAEIERRARPHVLQAGQRFIPIFPSVSTVQDEHAAIAAEYWFGNRAEVGSAALSVEQESSDARQ